MMDMNKPLNLGEGTKWYGGIGFVYYEDSTIADVVDTVRDWAEQNECYGHSYPYWALASDFGIPEDVVREIEEEAKERFVEV